MNISCNIIKDLLPGYATNSSSYDTQKLVDEHLCICDGCTKELAVIYKSSEKTLKHNTKSHKRLKKVLAITTSIMMVLTIIVAISGWLFVDVWMDAEEAVISVEAQKDGSLMFHIADYAMGHYGDSWGEKNNYHRHAWYTNRYEKLRIWWQNVNGIERGPNQYHEANNWKYDGEKRIEIRMDDANHYYYNVHANSHEVILWGSDIAEDYPETHFSNTLSQNFKLAFVLSIVFFAISKLIKNNRFRSLLFLLATFSGSIVLSSLFLTGGRLTVAYYNDGLYSTLTWAYIISLFLTMTMLLFYRLRKMKN